MLTISVKQNEPNSACIITWMAKPIPVTAQSNFICIKPIVYICRCAAAKFAVNMGQFCMALKMNLSKFIIDGRQMQITNSL